MPPSEAFQLALDEVVRVWDAADHLDTKILQFTSIISAGVLAGAGLFFGRRDLVGLRWCSPQGLLAGFYLMFSLLAFATFFACMIRAAIGTRFAAPLDPRVLAGRPELLLNDHQFETEMLPVIAAAFDASTKGLARKLALFKIGIVALACSLGALIPAVLLFLSLSSS